jgi:hypothetical protein
VIRNRKDHDGGEPPPAGSSRGTRAGKGNGIVLAVLAVLGLALIAGPLSLVLGDDSPSSTTTRNMGDVGGIPVDLDTLSPELASLYRSAERHGDHFTKIPCFCGCQEGRLEHRNLLDCYVLRDGRGWESHAVGCDVCQGEARLALSLLDEGLDIGEVTDKVIDAYGMPEGM